MKGKIRPMDFTTSGNKITSNHAPTHLINSVSMKWIITNGSTQVLSENEVQINVIIHTLVHFGCFTV